MSQDDQQYSHGLRSSSSSPNKSRRSSFTLPPTVDEEEESVDEDIQVLESDGEGEESYAAKSSER
jgi:hypothetical protein